MKIVNCKLKIANKAFTLIELMVAIAIVGILAAVVMVQMSSYGKKARASRALAQASSAIPSMVSCWGNGGNTNASGYICKISGVDVAGYGSWPTLPTNYNYVGNSITNAASKNPWVFSVTGESQTICCNSKMNSCGMPVACNVGATW